MGFNGILWHFMVFLMDFNGRYDGYPLVNQQLDVENQPLLVVKHESSNAGKKCENFLEGITVGYLKLEDFRRLTLW